MLLVPRGYEGQSGRDRWDLRADMRVLERNRDRGSFGVVKRVGLPWLGQQRYLLGWGRDKGTRTRRRLRVLDGSTFCS